MSENNLVWTTVGWGEKKGIEVSENHTFMIDLSVQWINSFVVYSFDTVQTKIKHLLESDIPGKYMYKTDSYVTNYNMYPQL